MRYYSLVHIEKSARGPTIRNQVFIATGLTVVLALVVVAMYWGGLSGAFLLDDTPNLNVIAQLPANPVTFSIWQLLALRVFLAGQFQYLASCYNTSRGQSRVTSSL